MAMTREEYLTRCRERSRKYRQENPEKARASHRKWYRKNPAAVRKHSQTYREKDRANIREIQRRWYRRNIEKAQEQRQNWKRENPEKVQEMRYRHRAYLYAGGITKEEYATLPTCCVYCLVTEEDANLELEHLVPVSQGGWHVIENVMRACSLCNRSKQGKLLGEWLTQLGFDWPHETWEQGIGY